MENEFPFLLIHDQKIVPHVRNEVLNLISFIKEVDWSEPWLICLLMFHVFLTVITIVTRHHGNFQGIVFFLLLLLVLCSSKLNELAATYWKYFSRQQYFDSNGMFISLVFSSPILLNCLIMVGHWVWTSGSLMVKVKRAQSRQRKRRESVKKEKEPSPDHHSKGD